MNDQQITAIRAQWAGVRGDVERHMRLMWEHPELPNMETMAAKQLCDWLEGAGFELERGACGVPTAFIARWRQGDGPRIAILLEYDALPGTDNTAVGRREARGMRAGHACGHNQIGAANAGAAIAAKAAMVERGIGGEIAKVLHGAGATVALSGTRVEPLEALATELGGRCHVLPCNLSDPQAVESLPKQAVEAMGAVDILVNNAGITRDQIFMRMSDDEWQSVLDVNLTATMRLCRGVMRPMMKARWGRIINISSIVGATGNPGQANYAASKAGLVGMTKSIAYEVASRGITANAVAPGFIATAMTDKLTDDQKAAINTKIPAARMGAPEEIAAAVLYLASPEAGYVTGTTLHVNGGMAMI